MRQQKNVGAFQIALVVLSVYVLTALTVEITVPLQAATRYRLQQVDTAICVLFLYDFFSELYRADNKLKFLKWGWIDFISSIPVIPSFQLFRWGRAARLFRILRAIRSVRRLLNYLYATRARAAFTSVLAACTVLIFASAITVLHVEADADGATIKNVGDAFWWAVVTITTVGYGDKVPTTLEGRLVALVLMTAGVGLFGVFTAFVASWFMEKKSEGERSIAELHAEIVGLRQEMGQLRAEWAKQEHSTAQANRTGR